MLPVFTTGTSASRARAVATMNHAAVRATSVLDGGNVAAVAFVPNDGRRAYASLATNGSDPAFSGVARSVDGGSSWRCQVDPSELRARSRKPGDLLWDHGLRSGLLVTPL